MLASQFSPLAPAAILLLGAFILLILFPRLPAGWQARPALGTYGAPVLIGLAVMALLGMRLTFGEDAAGIGLELLSGWNFSTAESAAALTVRADVLSFAFLILTLLILLSGSLAAPALAPATDGESQAGDVAAWLALGAGAGALFVSANGLTIGYAVLLFDIITALYWLRRGQSGLSVARLFLGVFTASGLILATVDAGVGRWLFGLALWARLGLYPFFETTIRPRLHDYGRLVYLSLSLAVGFYLVIRGLAGPLPEFVRWLAVVTMLLSGLLTWLAEERPNLLSRLILTQAGLILLAGTLTEGLATAYALGLILSLVALWVTPHLGKPELTERAWPWPYLPAAAATLTLIGLPLSLGWPVRTALYRSLFSTNSATITIVAILAEGVAFSGLVCYWRNLSRGSHQDERRSVAGIVTMVPFLIPGLAPFILGTIMRTELPAAAFDQPVNVFMAMVATIAGGFGLGYFQGQILERTGLSPALLVEFLQLRWLLSQLAGTLDGIGKAVLRVRVFLEGQHYMGWTLLMALVGVLIILLGS